MSGCKNCCGNCGGCGDIVLSEIEIELLQALAQLAFLPLGQNANGDPLYLEEQTHSAEEYTNALLCLEKRGLVSLDYSTPLKAVDYSRYGRIHGSFALTAKGQQIVELLDIQGITE